MQQTAGHLFSSTSGGCQSGGKRRRRKSKAKRKRKRKGRRKTQRGGRVLYGPTFTELESVSNIGGLNRGVIPHSNKNSTCSADGNMRGGGHTLVGTPISGIGGTKGGHGYGYVLGGDQTAFRGTRAEQKPYNRTVGCPQSGGKRKRKRRRKRKTRRKSRRKSKRRRRRRTKKVMKGGNGEVNYSFTGETLPGIPKGNPLGISDIKVNNYKNCPNTYNHYTRKST